MKISSILLCLLISSSACYSANLEHKFTENLNAFIQDSYFSFNKEEINEILSIKKSSDLVKLNKIFEKKNKELGGEEIFRLQNPKGLENFLIDVGENKVVGIGAVLKGDQKSGDIFIEEIIEGGGAFNAHLKINDKILKINGRTLNQISPKANMGDIVEQIRGKEGTSLNLEIQRGDQKIKVKVNRKSFEISSFNSTFENEVLTISFKGIKKTDLEKIEAILKEKAPISKKIIFDLRECPGGHLNVFGEILALFSKENELILYEKNKKFRDMYYQKTFATKDGSLNYLKKKVSIVLSPHTGGGALYMACYFLSQGAKIDDTFPKSNSIVNAPCLIKKLEDLPNDYAILYPFSEILGPNGESIHKCVTKFN